MNTRLIKNVSLKNIQRNPFRSFLMILLIAFISFTLFAGIIVVRSLQTGLDNYKDRLGADVIVAPYEATTKGSFDDILLQGITGNYYMSNAYYNKISKIEGIEKISAQFYLTSAKASCCSVRVQIIGFDPETDFTIKPWIEKSYQKEINDGDIIVGYNITTPENRKITFYGKTYNVVGELARTGTGLDSAVYANINTVKEMAETSHALEYNKELEGIDVTNSVSSVFIKVSDGYSPDDVTMRINNSVKGIKAESSASMVTNIGTGLNNVSVVIGILISVVWVLAVIILIISFMMISNERKKEFAILRCLGTSRSSLSMLISIEAIILALSGSIIGVGIGALALIPISSSIETLFNLPFMLPSIGLIITFGLITIVSTVLVCFISTIKASYDISKSETGLLLREDA